uniref:Amino acid transporter transmembrane domain-containing protein n=1 Tax=Cuerna arida TaxID=1464854 RepID=A0A1B6FUZ6_9HEMI
MAANGQANMTEMETFLPKDASGIASKDGKYRISVSPAKTRDLEAERLNNIDGKYYDPFKERKVEHPTSDCDTLTHLLKASLGSGILSMPLAFKNTGVALGIFCTILVAVVCTHCCYIIVKCAHVLYYKTRVPAMSFADVGESAFANGPPWGRKFAKLARIAIQLGLFSAYFGTCSVYTVLIGTNFEQVVEYYFDVQLDLRVYILALLLPLILMSWVPNLKSLAPVSMVANLFMGLGLGITIYYLVQDMPSPREQPQFNIVGIPAFFSICIFAMEAIGVIMPLENSMTHPQHFTGLCGVLNQGMSGVTLIYILMGFLGYVKYGDATQDSITLNLPTEEWLAQSVKVLVGLAVFCTYGLQYYVCLDIVWSGLKDRYSKNARLAEYVVRTALTATAVFLAVAVPSIGPFIGLIGAFCFSLLGLIIPILIEIITYWDIGFGPCNWVIYKNILVFIFGIFALVFGSYTSIRDIVILYSPSNNINSTIGANATEMLELLENTLTSLNTSDVITGVNKTLAAVTNLTDSFS